MQWIIEYYRDNQGKQPVRDFIQSLPVEAQAKVYRTMKLLKDYGVLLKEPYTKQLKGKIRELRVTDKRGAIRILYFTVTGKRLVLLHGFVKKTDKTPEREIETAEKRMTDFMEREG
jgi:phage-related protein